MTDVLRERGEATTTALDYVLGALPDAEERAFEEGALERPEVRDELILWTRVVLGLAPERLGRKVRRRKPSWTFRIAGGALALFTLSIAAWLPARVDVPPTEEVVAIVEDWMEFGDWSEDAGSVLAEVEMEFPGEEEPDWLLVALEEREER